VKFASNFEGGEGVWHLSRPTFNLHLEGAAKIGLFSDEGMAKVVAWRNVTVDKYNRQIRDVIFNNPTEPWLKGDRLIFTEPAKDPNDDEMVATTDDEGEVVRVEVADHPLHSEFKCYALTTVLDTGSAVVAWAVHPESKFELDKRLARMSAEAQADPRRWKAFWSFKESFHAVRHAYAITAHRSQGSTYQNVFVDTMDILANPNRQEAFRCLYVACSRPSRKLILV
jgi:exodeoxyribonuclease-5